MAPTSEGIDVRRAAPDTAVIVEPAHMSRRSFGLTNGSALATVPSMIDDNELASQTVLDESEVFDDPFYEALMAVGLGDEEIDAGSEAGSEAGDEAAAAPEAGAAGKHGQKPPEAEHAAPIADSPAADDGAEDEDDAPIRGAHARQPAKAKAAPEPAAEPDNAEEPYEFGLATGSALAMLPSMIDDNELASQTVVEPFEVFDDPFYEALMAVEPEATAQAAEQADAGTADDESAPSPAAASAEPAQVAADEPDSGDESQGEAAATAVGEAEGGKAQAGASDEAAEPLYTTASALVDDEPEENADDADASAEHDAGEPIPHSDDAETADTALADSGEVAEDEDSLAAEREAEAPSVIDEEAQAPAAGESEESAAAETADTPSGDASAAVPDTASEENAATPAAEGKPGASAPEAPEVSAETEAPQSEAAAPADDGPHAAAQEPHTAPVADAKAETLPDDENIADAVDAMVVNADPDEGKTPANAADEATTAPKKRGLWSRIKGFFRRNR